MASILIDLLVAAGLLTLFLVSLEVGFRRGRRAVETGDERAGSQVSAVLGAILALVGLLLAFSFAAAGTRFLERQDLIVQEANAIGTAYLRAELLPPPHSAELRAILKDYVAQRLEVSARLAQGVTAADAGAVDRFHAAMWAAARDGALASPAMVMAVVPAVNDVIDLHSIRVATGRKHIPGVVLGLLIACSAVAMAVMGFGSGLTGRRRAPLTVSLALLITACLWITIDLDYPRLGLMQLSDAPLRELKF